MTKFTKDYYAGLSRRFAAINAEIARREAPVADALAIIDRLDSAIDETTVEGHQGAAILRSASKRLAGLNINTASVRDRICFVEGFDAAWGERA